MARVQPACDITKLTADLVEARKVAAEKIKGMRDGGTCCFDCPTIGLPWNNRAKNVNAQIEAAVKAAGFTTYPGYGASRGMTMLHGFPGDSFQGSPRTLGAEAVAKFLRERGWNTSVHYAMD